VVPSLRLVALRRLREPGEAISIVLSFLKGSNLGNPNCEELCISFLSLFDVLLNFIYISNKYTVFSYSYQTRRSLKEVGILDAQRPGPLATMQAGWEFEPYRPALMNAAAPQGGPHTPKRQVHSNACQACRDRKSKVRTPQHKQYEILMLPRSATMIDLFADPVFSLILRQNAPMTRTTI
jgi:hypothetical protein